MFFQLLALLVLAESQAMPVHNHMPAAQELDADALGMLVSCLCGTGSDQKVAARRVRPAMQKCWTPQQPPSGLCRAGMTTACTSESTCVPAGVCPWPGAAGDRPLPSAVSCVAATDTAEDNSLPQVPLQGGPALPSNAKLCTAYQDKHLPCPSTTDVHSIAERMHRLHLAQHSSQHAGVRYADM